MTTFKLLAMSLKNYINSRKVETTGVFKSLELTDEQYSRLVELVILGVRTLVRDDQKTEIGLQDIEQYILSFAKQFNATDLVKHELYDNNVSYYDWTDKLRISSNEILDYYKDHVFLGELSRRMALNDLRLRAAGSVMNSIEIEDLEMKYFDEFEKNDVANLKLMK